MIVFLEKEDEGNYRAVINDLQSENKIDKDLIKAIVESLEAFAKIIMLKISVYMNLIRLTIMKSMRL